MAFTLTPLIAAFALACVAPGFAGLPNFSERVLRATYQYALFGGYPMTVLLGVPAFMLLKQQVRASMLNCALTGMVIASMPWFLLGVSAGPDSASIDSHVTYANGVMTWWGWLYLMEFVGAMAVLGAFAGFVFWVIAAVGSQRSK